MKELEETNCEIRNITNFDLPLWDLPNSLTSHEELATIDGLKESNLDETSGGFLGNDCKYAWLSHETRLVVIDVRYGKCITSWNFPNKVTSVSPFPSEPGRVPLLLVGLDNNAIRIKDSIGHLCIFDCCISTVLTTIQVPAGVEKACIIHGGADWEEYNDKRPDTVLSGNTGLIFAALRNLQHIVIDINRPLWKNLFLEGKTLTAKLEFVNTITNQPNSNKSKKEPVHLAYDLMDTEIEQYIGFDRNDFEATPLYDESLCSVLLSSTKIGCFITGCLGRVIIWQNDGSIGWISPPFDENAYVTHIALLEPSDDPRPFYYLWIACQSDSSESSAVLRMYTMLFNKKYIDKSGESSLYYNLESEPSLKFELELEQGERVHSLLAVERENSRDSADIGCRRGEDSLLLIGSDERLLLFDLNRWYKEQMPRTMAECRNPNSVMASYRTKSDELVRNPVIACSYIPRSLREFPTKGPSSPEELFYPNSLILEWVELELNALTFWLARGVQSELLREMTIAGPIVLVKPTETYRRCLAAGLLPFDSTIQDYLFDADKSQQRDMLLSLCLEQRWASFLVRCATEWSDGSAAYLYPEFLRWGVQRASELKLIADRLCVPLFDQSGSNIGESEVKTLRFCGQQLECLTTVVSKLPNPEADLEKQRRALKRITTYLEVLLWFCDVGLLPETQEVEEEDEMPPITLSIKIPYPKEKLIELYNRKRRNSKSDSGKVDEALFIDQLMIRDCFPLRAQWEREASSESPNPGGYYPPPSLQSLLRSYLTDCHREDCNSEEEDEFNVVEIENKHSITIYLLMDLAMLLQGTHPGVDQLIKYPSAFKLSPSLIKITQAFWLLDHDDYEGFYKIMTGQLICPTDIKDWHHKLAVESLLRNDQHKLSLMYLRILKPPLSSLEDQGTIISLSVGQGLVESAFHSRPSSHYAQLLTKFFQACKANGKLHDILQLSLNTEEEDAFMKFLKEDKCEDTRLLYYLQRCRHTEASDVFAYSIHGHSLGNKKIHPIALKVLNAFNATLPEVTKRFAGSINNLSLFNKNQQRPQQSSFLSPNSIPRSNESRGYPRPMSQCRNQVKEIYEVALQKTRETCSKVDRGTSNYLPFLGAPCSTIVYCTRLNGNTVDQSDATGVFFPERKVTKNKRTLEMMNDGEVDDNAGVDRKRRRLGSVSETNLSRNDNEHMIRRLSMSQVCNTPLVMRKARPMDGRDGSGLVTETPHSILKIRQMIRRNSNSPGYGFGNGSSERASVVKCTAAGDSRSARQIRFSMDRFSGNDDSAISTNDSNREEHEQESSNSGSSKNAEEESCAEESYYSPNVSNKSMRDSSILTDSSFTKYICGPRPRPSLRRSNLSRTSSDLSHKTTSSDNTTLNSSTLETAFERNKKMLNVSISPRKSMLSTSLYSASILSPTTSVEGSPLKRPLVLSNTDRKDEDETEESDDQSNDEEVTTHLSSRGIDKNSSIKPVSTKVNDENEDEEEENGRKQETEDEEEQNEMLVDNAMESQDEEESEKYGDGTSTPVNLDLLHENEISEDEEERPNEVEEPQEELEEGECDPEDTFQSLSNSFESAATSESITNCLIQLDDNLKRESKHSFTQETYSTQRVSVHRYNFESDYSFTKNIRMDSDSYEYQSGNYSLTKPIFIDNRGMVTCNDSAQGLCEITDDESMDADVDKPKLSPMSLPEDNEEQEKQDEEQDEEQDEDQNDDQDEEAELTLNLSASDGSNESPQKKQQSPRYSNESSLEKEISPRGFKVAESPENSELTKREQITPTKIEHSLRSRSRQSSLSSTKSDELTPTRRSTRNKTNISVVMPSPRRSIKSVTTSPTVSKVNEPIESGLSARKSRENRSTSVTKEVKKILSKAIGEPALPMIRVDFNSSIEDEEKEKTQSSPFSTIPESIKSTMKNRSLSWQSLRESLQDKSSPLKKDEETIMPKRSTRASQKEKSQELAEFTTTADKITKTQGTRANSVSKEDTSEKKDADKPIRRTRATSVTKDIEEVQHRKPGRPRGAKASSMAKETTAVKTTKEVDEDQVESLEEHQNSEKVLTKSRSTRATSLAKYVSSKISKEELEESHDLEISKSRSTRLGRTRAGSVAKDEVTYEEKPARKTRASSMAKEETTQEEKPIGRKTRAGFVAKEESMHLEKPTARKTRAGSAVKEEAKQEEKPITRKTRAGSVAKEEETKTATRKTRASSLTKETSVTGEDNKLAEETSSDEHNINKRLTRKRGNSVPKELPGLDASRLTSRNRRSTSLLKEVILEESISQLESPVNTKPNRLPRAVEEAAASSPAANTRSRRSSIQSIPEEIDEIVSVPQNIKSSVAKRSNESKDVGSRSRRAVSVDSSIVIPAGKRLTRGVLAKTAGIEVIPEESPAIVKSSRKPPVRRKRATSVPVDTVEEIRKEKAKLGGKPKRGRKASESKDFLFSAPEEAGEVPTDTEDECRTPIYKFSEPTGLQKFISPILIDDEDTSDLTYLLRRDKTNSERTSVRIQRRPRACFVLPKNTKDKAN